MRAAVLALAGALALGGCAGDMLTLSENEDGEATGAVAILDPVTEVERAVLDTKLTEAKLTSRPKPREVKGLKPAYNDLLDSLPPRAKRFSFTFPTGDTKIPVGQRSRLNEIRNELLRRQGAQIEVVGFTDSDGGPQRNDEISRERALAVVAELQEFGLPVDTEDAVGQGEDEAKAKLGDGIKDESYRKVEVVIR